MTDIPLVRLLSMAVTLGITELHDELHRQGHPGFRPVHGFALLAVTDGHDTASALAPRLGMTKQGAAKLLEWLQREGYLEPAEGGSADARRKPVVVTARGSEVVRLAGVVQDDLEQRWAALVGERRMATTRRVLEQVVLDGTDGPPPVRPVW